MIWPEVGYIPKYNYISNFQDLRLLGRVQPQDPAASATPDARGLLPLAQRAGGLQPGLLDANAGPSVSHARGSG